jgi:hypothetical protein
MRNKFPKGNSLISNIKEKVLGKAPSTIVAFKGKLSTITLPPQPVLTD